ncbi:hypothetical protein DNU06_04370 [Putridiphycobacter roseus]|uniref:WG repeat-containing protein n=1 Tax=Putridiphycobacter roseus TaxID=2219161 RepID=A0A2W1N2U3_9FLAO|nr:hypothetical protein [Putridiphycobacter roseus]PZE17860.1 hypothetical protein DNU06_04370 [Putridiphycobacter roseus]
MVKKIFVVVLFWLFLFPLKAQSQMSLDSVIGKLYTDYNVGNQLTGFSKKNGDFYIRLSASSSEVKFWDNQTNTFSKLEIRPNYYRDTPKNKVAAAKKQWYGQYYFFDLLENFGYEGYYNDEIEKQKAKDFQSAFALGYCYMQKALNKFKPIYKGLKSEQFDFEKNSKMNKKQETLVRSLLEKVKYHTNVAMEFANSDAEKEQVKRFLAHFNTVMFSMFEVHAKKVNAKEWFTEGMYGLEAVDLAKNKLIGVGPGDVIFCDQSYGELLYVQHHYHIAKGALIVPIHLLRSKYYFSYVLSKIGVKKQPDWLSQFDKLKPIPSNATHDLNLSEALELSQAEEEKESKSGYYFNYKNTKIPIGKRYRIYPTDLLQYFIIENCKDVPVYWSTYYETGVNNNLVMDGFLLRLIPTQSSSEYVPSISGIKSYDKIVNEFEFDLNTMTAYYKGKYSAICTKTIESLAKDGEIQKAQALYKFQNENFTDHGNISLADVELPLSLNLPTYATDALRLLCNNFEPGIYDNAKRRDQISTTIWKLSTFPKKYDCPELSDVLHDAKIYTKNTVKINQLEDEKLQLSTLTGQAIVPEKYDFIQNLPSNYYIVQNGNDWSVLDISGKKVTNEKYLSIQQMGHSYKVQTEDGYGLILNNFKTIIPTKYTELNFSAIKNYANNSQFIVVRDKDKFGILEIKNGTSIEVLPVEYDVIETLTGDYPQYFKCVRGTEIIYLLQNGEKVNTIETFNGAEEELEVVDMGRDALEWETRERENKLENVGIHTVTENGLTGVVSIQRNNSSNPTEKFSHDTIPLIYDAINIDKAHYNWFFAKKAGLWGCVNIKNEILIPFKYSEIGRRHLKSNTKRGLPITYVAVKDKAWGVFACEGNSQSAWNLGREICEMQYDSIAYNKDAGFLIWQEGKVGVVSTVFPNKVVPPAYKKYKGVNNNFIQPIYTFIDDQDREVRVYSGGGLVE